VTTPASVPKTKRRRLIVEQEVSAAIAILVATDVVVMASCTLRVMNFKYPTWESYHTFIIKTFGHGNVKHFTTNFQKCCHVRVWLVKITILLLFGQLDFQTCDGRHNCLWERQPKWLAMYLEERGFDPIRSFVR
jgi:hypothetical protein